MESKRKLKEITKEAYAISEKKVKRDKTIFTKKLNSINRGKCEQANTRVNYITGMIHQSVHYKNKYSKEEGYNKMH